MMMSDDVVTTEDIVHWVGWFRDENSETFDQRRVSQFYLWLDEVLDEARAAAWEAGWAKGALSEKTSFGRTVSYEPKINPYVVSDLEGSA